MSDLLNSKESAIFYAMCSLAMLGLVVYAILTIDMSDGINIVLVAIGALFAVIFGRQALVFEGGDISNG